MHGGIGYIEETGAAQYLRDARIFAIYEGTNGIQAIDLVTAQAEARRRRGRSGGSSTSSPRSRPTRRPRTAPDFGNMGARLSPRQSPISRRATEFLAAALAGGRTREALAGATPYLRLFALTDGGALLAKGALAAAPRMSRRGWVALARSFAETIVARRAALRATDHGRPGMRRNGV